jgi:hypothetical protein
MRRCSLLMLCVLARRIRGGGGGESFNQSEEVSPTPIQINFEAILDGSYNTRVNCSAEYNLACVCLSVDHVKGLGSV